MNGTPTTTVATRKDKGGLTDHIDLKTAFTIISAKRLSLFLVQELTSFSLEWKFPLPVFSQFVSCGFVPHDGLAARGLL